MRVCMILEGCYPFVRGGVSSWAHQYISCSPETEFVLWTIHASGEDVKEPLYKLPDNVTEHHMIVLNESRDRKGCRMPERHAAKQAAEAMRKVLMSGEDSFEQLAALLRGMKEPLPGLLQSEPFLALAQQMSNETPGLGLSDAFYSLQSMFMPICKVLTASIPEADVYHTAVTGYGGLLGAMASTETGKPLVLTEHGIYPREREEELISSDWAVPAMRPVWIRLFYEMSKYAYRKAARVTSLFRDAMARQITIGCDPARCVVIPNGIRADRFMQIGPPDADEKIHIGAFVRFAAIKDLKTLIHAFHTARQETDNLLLHIMGDTDDPDYRASCEALIRRLGEEESIIPEGHISTPEYMQKMHMTILTSISEGQPLTILESMASGRPCIATRVGNCAGLIEEEIDGIGAAGIICTPMMPDEIAGAIVKLSTDSGLRSEMGENGRKRIRTQYLLESMLDSYHRVYQEVI